MLSYTWAAHASLWHAAHGNGTQRCLQTTSALEKKKNKGEKRKEKKRGKTMSADHVSPCCNGHVGRVHGLHLYVEPLMAAPEMFSD